MHSSFRRWTVRGVVAVAALAVVPLVGGSAAQASASNITNVGSTVVVPANSVLTAGLTCPAGTASLSGGFVEQQALTATVLVYESRPDAANWRFSIRNYTGTGQTVNLSATCGSVTSRTVISADIAIPGQGTASVSVDCPSGQVNVGGGYRNPGSEQSAISVRTSRAFSSGQGWLYTVHNSGGAIGLSGTGYAICGSVSGRVIRDASDQFAPQAGKSVTATCPAGKVATAIGWVTNSNEGWALNGALVSGASAQVMFNNQSHTTTYTMTSRAVCVPAS
jgi:hypothetical protein